VLVFGHTHKPYIKRVDGVLFVNAGSSLPDKFAADIETGGNPAPMPVTN
jgi:predicted phosphodiesterase